ncbi:MAG: insulinase family protein [Myxococcaceae bacterium]
MRAPLVSSLLVLAACATPQTRAPVTPTPPAPAPVWSRSAPPQPAPRAALAPPPTRELTLPSGLRIVVVEHHRRPLVSIRLFFRDGAAAEREARAGVTAIAVALLGDTFDDEDKSFSEEESARRQVAEAGASFRADVTADHSWIGIDGHARETARYLRMLDRIVTLPRCSGEVFTYRVDGALAALEDAKLSPEATFADYVARRAFGAGTAYARSVLGTPKSLDALEYEEVQQRQRELLQPSGSTLLIAGDVKADEVLARAQAIFSRWRPMPVPSSRAPKPRAVSQTKRPTTQAAALVPRSPAHTTLVCAARAIAAGEGADATLDVLARVLGRRLSQALREELGMTYHASATVIRRRHARVLQACSAVRTEHLRDGVRTFSRTVEALRTAPPDASEVEWARALGAADLRASQAELASLVESWTTALELGERSADAPSRLRAVEAVTDADMKAAADRLLLDKRVEWILSGDPEKVVPAVRSSELGWRLVQLPQQ